MRLINTETGRFESFFNLSTTPPYAILSHTWDKNGEQTYQEVVAIQENYRSYSDGEIGSNLSQNASAPVPEEVQGLSPSDIYAPSQTTPSMNQVQAMLHHSLSRTSSTDSFESEPQSQPPHLSSTAPSIWDSDSGLTDKVRRACEIARRDGFRYIWIDSSCIDKTSSSELSEAINSMFNWYRGAQVCYAFLADVPSATYVEDRKEEASDNAPQEASDFSEEKLAPTPLLKHSEPRSTLDDAKLRQSRWFRHAWTLQELVAPRVVVFLSEDWEPLGTKHTLADLIQDITYIDRGILTHARELDDETIAERMRWASTREATRVEDEAYSLLGIFGITMPTLYGEGRYAFQRLQQEILQHIPDQSLFAWGFKCVPIYPDKSDFSVTVNHEEDYHSPFAPSPSCFRLRNGKFVRGSGLDSLNLPINEYTHTPFGIRTNLLLVPVNAFPYSCLPFREVLGNNVNLTWYFAILGCQHNERGANSVVGRLCNTKPNSHVLHTPLLRITKPFTFSTNQFGVIFSISIYALNKVKAQWIKKTIYLPSPSRDLADDRILKQPHSTTLRFSLYTWTHLILQPYGYTISNICSSQNSSSSFSLTLTGPLFHIHIQFRYFSSEHRSALAIQARIWILSDSDTSDQGLDDIIHHTEPYTSLVWADSTPWSISLPYRCARLVASSGDETTLQLGLGLVTPSHYHVDVSFTTNESGDIATSELSPAVSKEWDAPYPVMRESQTSNLKLTIPGSVRQTLEGLAYAVHLEDSGSRVHSLSLVNNHANFIISVKYFYILRSLHHGGPVVNLGVTARVALESSSPCSDTLNHSGLDDGPYVVHWMKSADWSTKAWRWWTEWREVCLSTPGARDQLTFRLGLELAWKSEYYLLFDIQSQSGIQKHQGSLESSSSWVFQPDGSSRPAQEDCYMLREPHTAITFTLPGHVKNALREKGYHYVDFQEPTKYKPNHWFLTLSNTSHIFAIAYSYHLSINHDGQQILTLIAATTSTGKSDIKKMRWGTWIGQGERSPSSPSGWAWELPPKDMTLTMPTGLELTLRLGFYLVWLGEYCLTIEVNPESPITESENTYYRGS